MRDGVPHTEDLFRAFYEATSAIAFDFATGLTARGEDATSMVAASYEDLWYAHEYSDACYHVVPLLASVYAKSASYPRRAAQASGPGVDAVTILGEPYRSVLHLTERYRFSPEDTGHILGLGPEEVRREHDDARIVAHGVSAALALCPGGVPTCPVLAAALDHSTSVVAQTEAILEHAERCSFCAQTALTSPDPIRELRYGVGVSSPLSLGAPVTANGPSQPGLMGGPAAGPAAAAAVWSPVAAGASPLPAPAPLLASKAGKPKKSWAPVRLWTSATGWQKSGAIMAALLVVALAIAIAAGGDTEDVAARPNANTNSPGTNPQSSVTSSPPPIATIPSTTTTGPVTTVEQTPTTTPSTGGASTSPSTSGSSSSGEPPAASPSTTEPPPTTTTTTPPPPPPVIQSGSWGTFPFRDPATGRYSLPFAWSSTGTSSSWTTTWGASGSVQTGNSIQLFSGVPSGTQTITLSVTDAHATTTQEFPVTLP